LICIVYYCLIFFIFIFCPGEMSNESGEKRPRFRWINWDCDVYHNQESFYYYKPTTVIWYFNDIMLQIYLLFNVVSCYIKYLNLWYYYINDIMYMLSWIRHGHLLSRVANRPDFCGTFTIFRYFSHVPIEIYAEHIFPGT